ncbi:RidA family protein [Microvirga sp. P5_D2]
MALGSNNTYSASVSATQGLRAGGFIFCAGQLPVDPGSGTIPDGIRAQTVQSLENLAAVLAASGASLSSVVKTTIFLDDLNDLAVVNHVYNSFFPTNPPARTTVEVARLRKDALVEIDAIALVGEGDGEGGNDCSAKR